jgi:3-oxoacid CoA-transferase subunit A
MEMNKLVDSAMAAIDDIRDGATLMVGGFGLCGIPEHLIEALRVKGVKNLVCISNNAGVDDFGLGRLLKAGQVRKMVSSYVGENKTFERLFLEGALEVELVPQGTLAERIRAGGAGIPAFYTPTGVGTPVAAGKETKVFDGREYVLERALKADFALVKARRGDPLGNLQYDFTAMNFNPAMATAAKVTIAEVEEVVSVGELNPMTVHTPGIYVQRLVHGGAYEKRIEQRTTRARPEAAPSSGRAGGAL